MSYIAAIPSSAMPHHAPNNIKKLAIIIINAEVPVGPRGSVGEGGTEEGCARGAELVKALPGLL